MLRGRLSARAIIMRIGWPLWRNYSTGRTWLLWRALHSGHYAQVATMRRCCEIDGAGPYGAGRSRPARATHSYSVCRNCMSGLVPGTDASWCGRLQPRECLLLHCEAHGGLLNWELQCIRLPKLCPVQPRQIRPNTAPYLRRRHLGRATCA